MPGSISAGGGNAACARSYAPQKTAQPALEAKGSANMDDLTVCPSCGALPCDWTDNPSTERATLLAGQERAVAEAVELLSEAVVLLDNGNGIADDARYSFVERAITAIRKGKAHG